MKKTTNHPEDLVNQFPKKDAPPQSQYAVTPPSFSVKEKKNKVMVPIFNSEIKKNLSFSHYDTSVGMPPFSTTNFSVTETGNSDPNLVRSTMYVVPKNNSLLENTGIPLSFILTPFNNKSYFHEIDDDPVQCMQCMGYFNGFSILFEPLKGFKCNLCGTFNKAEKDYNFPTAEYKLKKAKGLPKKKEIINEEYFNQEEYLPPAFVFCIELSKIMVATNYYEQILDAIQNVFEEECFENVAFLIFSDEITILKCENGFICEKVLSDFGNLPFSSPEIFFKFENKDEILAHLRKMQPRNSIFPIFPLVKYLCQLGNFFVGSKIAFFTSSTKETSDPELLKEVMMTNRVSLNLFTIGQNDFLEKIVSFTNGKVFRYVNSTDDLQVNLSNLWNEKSVYGVTLQIKTSDQIGKKEIFGNGDTEGTSLSIFSHMDCKSSVGVSFFIEEEIKQEKVFFQIILNYFKEDGQKYVLVCNLGLQVSGDQNLIYNNLCFDTIFASFLKFILSDFNEWSARKKVVEDNLVKAFSYYRKKCAKNPSPTHLHIPESLKLLPLMFQSMNKNALFNTETRYSSFQNLLGNSVLRSLRFFYPRMISFSDYFVHKNLEEVDLQNLSYDNLDPNEIYILDNGEKIYVYFGKEVLEELKMEIKNGSSEEKEVFSKLVDEICCEYVSVLPVVFINENGPNETEFLSCLVEDKMHGHAGYEDFICEFHFKVRKSSS